MPKMPTLSHDGIPSTPIITHHSREKKKNIHRASEEPRRSGHTPNEQRHGGDAAEGQHGGQRQKPRTVPAGETGSAVIPGRLPGPGSEPGLAAPPRLIGRRPGEEGEEGRPPPWPIAAHRRGAQPMAAAQGRRRRGAMAINSRGRDHQAAP